MGWLSLGCYQKGSKACLVFSCLVRLTVALQKCPDHTGQAAEMQLQSRKVGWKHFFQQVKQHTSSTFLAQPGWSPVSHFHSSACHLPRHQESEHSPISLPFHCSSSGTNFPSLAWLTDKYDLPSDGIMYVWIIKIKSVLFFAVNECFDL